MVGLNTVDNKDKAWVFVNVLPEHRNAGLGHSCSTPPPSSGRWKARSTTAVTAADYPLDAGDDHPYRRSPPHRRRFASCRPECTGCSTCRPTRSGWARLEAEAAPHHTAYTFLEFEGLPHGDIRADYCVLGSTR